MISSPSKLNGVVNIPASKSHTIRAVTLAVLSKGLSRVHNPLVSRDTEAIVIAARALGADVDCSDESCWRLNGVGTDFNILEPVIDIKNSGTTLYIMMSVMALNKNNPPIILTGDEQTKKRPAQPLIDSLNQLGANIRSVNNNGCAPIEIRGILQGGETSIEAVTSQYLSSILIATPLARNDSIVYVPVLYERPYIEMTLDWMNRYNIVYETNKEFDLFRIKSNQSYRALDSNLPGDFSSATFFFVAGLIAGGEILIKGLDMNDTQGDKSVIDMLKKMGGRIDITDEGIRVYGSKLKGTKLDLNNTPDALPALSVAACFATGETILHNVPQARLKETDRINAMCKVLSSLGADIEEMPDGLIIRKSELSGGTVDGFNDHRIVMSLAVAGFASNEKIMITSDDAVDVTFPTFIELMSRLGALIEND